MTSAYVLILAMLVLGGLLATLGDRLGTKVGKARLSLFNLRPRQTATVVTIITGIIISSSTLGILFATSKSLRVGIFQLDEKLKELRQAREELTNVTLQKTQVEQALAEAKTEQTQAQQQLDEINEYLLEAIDRQTETAAKLNQAETKLSETQTEFQRAKTQLSLIESQYQRAQSQLETFSEQAQTLRQEIQQLQSERQELLRQTEEVKLQIAQRDREIAKRQLEIEQRDAEIAKKERQIVEQEAQISQREAQISQQEAQISQQEAQISQQKQEITEQQEQIARRQTEIDQRDRTIAERENRLKQLERQQAFLERDIEELEVSFQILREGNFAILRNQVLASGVVRVLEPSGARQAAEELLREANVAAIERIRPGTNAGEEKVVQITPTELDRLINEINDGRAYVVRIIASANYLVGENTVQVFADAALNKIIFLRGEILAGTSVSPATMTEEMLRERIDLLLASASFRARRAGILSGPIEIAEGRLTLLEFIEQLQQYDREVIIQAIASEAIYTAGPLKINLVVIQNGQIIFNN